MQWYLKVLKNYTGFQGRASRKEFWMYSLFSFIITLILVIIEEMVNLSTVLSGIYSLAVLLPSLAVGARRLHDTGRSGWWQLLVLLPIIGGIILLVFCCLDSQKNENKYGPNPKLS